MCIRQALKVSPKELPDRDIDIFVKALDDDGSGDLDIEELADFVERGVATFGAGPLDEEERTALRWGERDEAGGLEERARLKEEAEKQQQIEPQAKAIEDAKAAEIAAEEKRARDEVEAVEAAAAAAAVQAGIQLVASTTRRGPAVTINRYTGLRARRCHDVCTAIVRSLNWMLSGALSVGQLPFTRTRQALEDSLWDCTTPWGAVVGRYCAKRSAHRTHINEVFREARQVAAWQLWSCTRRGATCSLKLTNRSPVTFTLCTHPFLIL